MLYLIGIGLNDEKDLSIKALEVLRKCDRIYVEFYTSSLNTSVQKIEELIGRKVELLSREEFESNFFVKEAKTKDVALLIPGDPLSATTHISIIIDCIDNGIAYEIIHSSSIFSAIAETGLSNYKFGRVTSLPWPRENFKPTSYLDVIQENKKLNLHTLLLLDTQPPMSVNDALRILLEQGFNEDDELVAVTNLGGRNQKILFLSIKELLKHDFQNPQSLIIPAKLDFVEEEAITKITEVNLKK